VAGSVMCIPIKRTSPTSARSSSDLRGRPTRAASFTLVPSPFFSSVHHLAYSCLVRGLTRDALPARLPLAPAQG
jgi:hypothetical protein